jgi:gliding motility-associated lipoprotein GldD
MNKLLIITIITLLLVACGSEDYTPKPRVYPRMVLPEKGYKNAEGIDCDFMFQQPIASEIQQEKEFFGENIESSCWFDIYYPQLNGAVHFTYYPITKDKPLYKLVEDAYKMEEQHIQKASYMDHAAIVRRDANVFGEITNIGGDVGTPFQFYLTDSTTHFLRAGLTFNASANSDSLAPAVQHVKDDMITLIESFQWKE